MACRSSGGVQRSYDHPRAVLQAGQGGTNDPVEGEEQGPARWKILTDRHFVRSSSRVVER
ncbi:hypothetical protein TSAR_007455 [Trichomalopsis sarcophagae]|uniref:Uncharacterized protein n=1 Tax=Trichomalopsis sarcophagae TaxID=543379 RepID=A0A232EJ18_9HYME|nr:hypothetical protein TSAR_007455 [Trichomalopsis sarcophagae]